jgi:glycerophosphoryl diester phosphodiesterase
MMKYGLIAVMLSWAAALCAQQPLVLAPSSDGPRVRAPQVCAHRGRLSGSEMENSLGVMRHTFSEGISCFEFDLRVSADGVMYLSHDLDLDRTTDGRGAVARESSAELDRVMVVDPVTRKPLEALTRFNDLLAWAEGKDVLLMVDLKDTPPAAAVALLRKHGLMDKAVLLTFDRATTDAALAADALVRVSILAKDQGEVDWALREAHGHPIALYVPQTGDAALFVYAHRSGVMVLTDAMGGPDVSLGYGEFLKTHPTDVLFTDHGLDVRKAVDRR